LRVKDRNGAQLTEARLEHTSHVCALGNVQVSTQALRELCVREIPVVFASWAGWMYGRVEGVGHKNVGLRAEQFAVAADAARSLPIARAMVSAKITNSRTLLRRNHAQADVRVLRGLKEQARSARDAKDAPSLLGFEGTAARAYFGCFNGMLKAKNGDDASWRFELDGRNRRPPRDPVNALLSFAYSLLLKDCLLAVTAVGFDPYMGFYHRPRYGRPALALDVMEEFRPLVADSVVITAVNTRVVGEDDFIRVGHGVALRDGARRRFIDAYERRMAEVIRHPVFGYRVSYRRVLAVQARLLARYILGEIDAPPTFTTR
jgi:CRISPR-associated protein Cas1